MGAEGGFSTAIFRTPGGWRAFGPAISRVETARVDEVRACLQEAEAWIARGGWVSGYVAYEAAPGLDASLVTRPPEGLLVRLALHEDSPTPCDGPAPRGPFRPADWCAEWSADEYGARFAEVRARLGSGDLYQANLTYRLRAEGVSADDLWHAWADEPPALSALWRAPGETVVSLSPELFLHRKGDVLRSRPMKGTAPLGEGDSLLTEKSRAENLMIVDMVRSDLGRIARPGTVTVPELFAVESVGQMLQMSSTVEAQSSAGFVERFAALFPCASVTGAPRVAAMARLAEWETSARGIYCGAVGWAGPEEERWSVAIRTARIAEGGEGVWGVGSGLVWDSDLLDEWAECGLKASALGGPAWRWLETMGADPGAQAAHLDRIARSAAAAGLPFDRAATERALIGASGRVRLTVGPGGGDPRVESRPLDPWPLGRVVRARLAPCGGARSDDPWLKVKTTRRLAYERARALFPGSDEVLLRDEGDRLTEFLTGNLLLFIEGRWLTPDPSGPLLAGIGVGRLLARGEVSPAVLTPRDLGRAERIEWINDLRGRFPVKMG